MGMILRKDMSYRGDERYPKENFTGEPEGTYYIVDESTAEGRAMVSTILACHPDITVTVAEDGITVMSVTGNPRTKPKSEIELLKDEIASLKEEMVKVKADITGIKEPKVP
jgi:hypothetical protein